MRGRRFGSGRKSCPAGASATASRPSASSAASTAHRLPRLCRPGSGVLRVSNTACSPRCTTSPRMCQPCGWLNQTTSLSGSDSAARCGSAALSTAMRGAASVTSRSLSSISTAQYSGAGCGSSTSSNGRPMLPTRPVRCPAARRRCATRAVVVLLPLVPVTHTVSCTMPSSAACAANHSAVPPMKDVPCSAAASAIGW
ncbi:hypothetical protein G6F65_019949 [Rhizopus arrhizus]|nr:hypothetical protein G6F65_019949 [Rhizopus arrhizus]